MTTDEALTILNLPMPRIIGTSQEDVVEQLRKWKEDILKKAWHAAAQASHPDRNPAGDAGVSFNRAQEAYQYLMKLRVKLTRPSDKCPNRHARIPVTAKFCHECGYAFDADPVSTLLRQSGLTERNIVHLRVTGELDELRMLSIDALRAQVPVLLQRQRVGLIHPRVPRVD